MKAALLLLVGLTLLALVFASQLYVVYRAESIPIHFGGMLILQLALWYPWEVAGPLAWSAGIRSSRQFAGCRSGSRSAGSEPSSTTMTSISSLG